VYVFFCCPFFSAVTKETGFDLLAENHTPPLPGHAQGEHGTMGHDRFWSFPLFKQGSLN